MTTLLIAAAGAAVFRYLDFPLPFLFGPMFASLVAALAGVRLRTVAPVSKAARTVLGVAVGASITPAVFMQLPNMALSVALVPLYLLVIAGIGVPFFHKVCGLDRVTAYYSAMPGGLQDMVLFGEEAGGDVRALSLIHATRVLLIVSLAPLILTGIMEASLANPVGARAATLPWQELLIMAAAALFGWKLAERAGMFGAAIIGPLIAAAACSLAGLIHSRPPAEAILFAQFFIGTGIGVGYVGVTLRELRNYVATGVLYVVLLAILAVIFSEIVVLSGLAEPLEGFLAFAPGGQAEMTVLAIIAGADLGYVVVHHLTRLVLVILCAPVFAGYLFTQKNGSGSTVAPPEKPEDRRQD
ncbi:AbrB family transcriptional regulator [Labrenzia aggregata]|uniref:AbrB family transcriptional regulator n=1 Tax=Roseibium aggregatum TaxID=187304 RepID=A0A939EHB9_9HYPH|nr:AbrB family transcriptional regulator [Roseibium aggregatum]